MLTAFKGCLTIALVAALSMATTGYTDRSGDVDVYGAAPTTDAVSPLSSVDGDSATVPGSNVDDSRDTQKTCPAQDQESSNRPTGSCSPGYCPITVAGRTYCIRCT